LQFRHWRVMCSVPLRGDVNVCVPQVKKKNMAADYMRVMRSGDYGAWVLDLGRISR
jgi:hypothetical protein